MPVAPKPSTAQSTTTAGALPDFPNLTPQFAGQPGGAQLNQQFQQWNAALKRRLTQFQNTNQQAITSVSASASGSFGTLTARIDLEQTVRASADSALSTSISTVSAQLVTDVATLTASISTETTARVTADGYLEGKYTLTITAGNVVTGMNITSASGPGTNISSVIFRATDFQIYNGTLGVAMFTVSGSNVNLANTLTVSTGGKIFSGTGTYGNSNTPFYVDSSSNFSLGDKLTFTGGNLTISGSLTATTGTIGGWTINSTTLSKNNAILDSAGQLTLGTSNDVVYLSSTNTAYRLWVGNVTAGSAAFSVTKGGALFSNSGTIGGYTISSSSITAGSGITFISLDTVSSTLKIGTTAGAASQTYIGYGLIALVTGSSTIGYMSYNSASGGYSTLGIGTNSGANIILDGLTGTATATTFSGSGASLTSINASNISSGTLSNARLPSSISVNDLTLTSSLTMNGGNQPLDITNGTVTFRSIVNNSTSRVNWGTTTNHSVEVFTNNTSRFFFGSDGNFKTQGGDFRKVSSDGWTPVLYDGSNQVELQASGGQIYGRINGGSAILLG